MKPATASALAALADTETVLLGGVELPSPPGQRAAGARAVGGPEVLEVAEVAGAGAGGAGPAGGPAAAPVEPVYGDEVTGDVQGNVIPGFNKDHQEFVFLRLGDVDAARPWLRWLAPRLATMGEVLEFRRRFRAARLHLGLRQPPLTATWVSAAFSHGAIAALAGPTAAGAFGEDSFRQGLAARSTYLGDPTDPNHPGHRSHWVVGGPDDEADVLVIVAADDPADLADEVDAVVDAAARHGITVAYRQRGDTLPGNLVGHEHFGFKDGVSQPGVRGATGTEPTDRLSPRYLTPDDPHAAMFAKPGQVLVWPGQFLLGEPRQDPMDPLAPAPAAANFPAWARRGSYVVCRRLRQDVVAFWELAATVGEALDVPPVHAASLLVGRWPSGAPLMRATTTDDATLAGDEFANNHFLFDAATRPSVLEPIDGYPGDTHTPAVADTFGSVCPHIAHIRRMNPRDSGTDFGAPADTLLRLMLRRGIPYGRPIAGVTDPSDELAAEDRGLLFVAYVASIEDQFEFVTRRWANSPVQPNVGGPDPIIGQRDRAGARERSIELRRGDGTTATIPLPTETVTATGGGYFFAPPISAIRDVLGG